MIMNMQNVPQQNQKCIASKSCSNIVAMNSAPPESSSPLLEQTIVEEGDDGKCKVRGCLYTHFCYDVTCCLY